MQRFRNRIIRFESQYALVRRFLFSVAPKVLVTICRLLKCQNVARIELDSALKISERLFPAPLTPFDVALQREYPIFATEAPLGNFQLAQSPVIIEVTPIKIAGAREVGFTGVWTEASRGLQSCFRLRQVCRSMV